MKNRSQKSEVRSQKRGFILYSVFCILTSYQDQGFYQEGK